MRTKYGFARKSTYALEAAYVYKVRLLRVSDLSLRVWPSDLVDVSEDCDRV